MPLYTSMKIYYYCINQKDIFEIEMVVKVCNMITMTGAIWFTQWHVSMITELNSKVKIEIVPFTSFIEP